MVVEQKVVLVFAVTGCNVKTAQVIVKAPHTKHKQDHVVERKKASGLKLDNWLDICHGIYLWAFISFMYAFLVVCLAIYPSVCLSAFLVLDTQKLHRSFSSYLIWFYTERYRAGMEAGLLVRDLFVK